MTISIVPASKEHIKAIADNVRPEDRDELWASVYATPENAMDRGIDASERAYTALADGKPFCMWGVVKESFLLDIGIPWMVGSKDLDHLSVKFLRRCHATLLDIFNGYDKLENYVDARNTRSIEWLRFMGFTIGEPEEYGMLKKPFHRFWKEKINV